MKPVVVLQYLSLIHYRRSVFDLLFKDERLDFKIVCGRNSPYSAMENYSPNGDQDVSFIKNVKLLGTRFLIQRGMLSVTNQKKPDVVVLLGVNPLILSSLYSAFYFSMIKGAKVYWWGHGTLGQQGWFGRVFRRLFYKLSEGVLVYGKEGRDNLVSNGFPPEKIHVVNNCLNEEDYGFDRSEISNNEFRILFSGRLTTAKRVEELIEVGRLLSEQAVEFKIDILGDGPELEQLKEKVELQNLEDYVLFHGAMYGEDAYRFFNEATVFVHPGAIGLSVIHALSFGLPVITSNNNTRNKPEMEVLVDGVNGSFYTVGEYTELAHKILMWKDRIETDRLKVIRECQASIEAYTPRAVADSIIAAVTNELKK